MTQPEPGAPSGATDPTGQSAGTVVEGAVTPPVGAPSGAVTPPEPAPTATVSAEDFKRLQVQLSQADKKREEAQQALQAIRDKDLPEIEKLKRDTATLTETNTRLTTQLREQAIELAFLRDNTIRWKDSAAALKLLDRSALQISDDGNVEGVKLASEKMAKAYAWMVDDGAPAEPVTPVTPPGGAPPMNGNPAPNKSGTKGMVNRLPALASRRRPTST